MFLEAKYTQFGELEDRFALRQELQCKNFQWFLENVYPESELLIGSNQIGKVCVSSLEYSLYLSDML